jgi:hypothetical protein
VATGSIVVRGCDKVVAGGCAAVVAATGGRVTKSTSPRLKIAEGTSIFTGPLEDRVLLKTNRLVVSDILRRLSPEVSEETARCGMPSKLKKTISVAL